MKKSTKPESMVIGVEVERTVVAKLDALALTMRARGLLGSRSDVLRQIIFAALANENATP